ncbi:MAG: helix-turn-helix domain-containing protein [Anaerolineales bacterium]
MVSESNIGARIRQRRKQLKLSLRALASQTDLTASFLSQVERGKTNASIDSLRRIASALDVSMLYFLSEPPSFEDPIPTSEADSEGSAAMPGEQYTPVVRADCRPQLILTNMGITYELLTPDLAHKMEVICGHLSPGSDNIARPLREPTEEWIYVLAGALLIELEMEEHVEAYILNPGDAVYFEGRALRRLACATEEETSWISVITPPAF